MQQVLTAAWLHGSFTRPSPISPPPLGPWALPIARTPLVLPAPSSAAALTDSVKCKLLLNPIESCLSVGGLQGMEPEIQRLLSKHKAELQAEREKAQDSTRCELGTTINRCRPFYPLEWVLYTLSLLTRAKQHRHVLL